MAGAEVTARKAVTMLCLWGCILTLLGGCSSKLPRGCPPECSSVDAHGVDLRGSPIGWPPVDLHDADLSNANLREALLGYGANLSGANLIGADLRFATLNGANLHGADLRWARLGGASLPWASLSDADLRWASLPQVDLRWANLSNSRLNEANLSGAHLAGANLSGANLRGADLRGAELNLANMRGADLRETNLSEARLFLTLSIYLQGANLGEATLPKGCVVIDVKLAFVGVAVIIGVLLVRKRTEGEITAWELIKTVVLTFVIFIVIFTVIMQIVSRRFADINTSSKQPVRNTGTIALVTVRYIPAELGQVESDQPEGSGSKFLAKPLANYAQTWLVQELESNGFSIGDEKDKPDIRLEVDITRCLWTDKFWRTEFSIETTYRLTVGNRTISRELDAMRWLTGGFQKEDTLRDMVVETYEVFFSDPEVKALLRGVGNPD